MVEVHVQEYSRTGNKKGQIYNCTVLRITTKMHICVFSFNLNNKPNDPAVRNLVTCVFNDIHSWSQILF